MGEKQLLLSVTNGAAGGTLRGVANFRCPRSARGAEGEDEEEEEHNEDEGNNDVLRGEAFLVPAGCAGNEAGVEWSKHRWSSVE